MLEAAGGHAGFADAATGAWNGLGCDLIAIQWLFFDVF